MKKVLCAALMILISTSFAVAQDDGIYIFGHWGLNNNFTTDPFYYFSNSLDPFLDFNSPVLGARLAGMGGVYYASDNEGYSSYLNPAGMIYTSKSLMSLDLFASMDKHSQPFVTASPVLGDPDSEYLLSSAISDIDGKHNRLDQAGAVAPFTYFDRDWWFGGGFRTVFNLHNELALPVSLRNQRALYTQHKGVDAINMALATNIMPNINLGINFNIYTRGYEQDYWFPYFVYDDDTGDTVQISGHLRDKSTFTGTNFDLGAIVDYDMIKAGFVISTPLKLTQKVLFLQGNVNPYGETNGVFDRLTIKNKFPLTFGGGVSFNPIENFSMGVDLTLKPFSKTRIDIDPEQNIYVDSTDHDPEWQDLTQFRVGAEYVFDAGFARVPLRAGLFNLPALKKTSNVSYEISYWDGDSLNVTDPEITEGDKIETYIISVGSGLRMEKIWFDFAYQFGSSEHNQLTEVDVLGETYTIDDPLKYKYARLYFSVGMLF